MEIEFQCKKVNYDHFPFMCRNRDITPSKKVLFNHYFKIAVPRVEGNICFMSKIHQSNLSIPV